MGRSLKASATRESNTGYGLPCCLPNRPVRSRGCAAPRRKWWSQVFSRAAHVRWLRPGALATTQEQVQGIRALLADATEEQLKMLRDILVPGFVVDGKKIPLTKEILMGNFSLKDVEFALIDLD